MPDLTPTEQAAIAPTPHRREIEARKLRDWCEEPWLSEMDRERYLGWAEEFARKCVLETEWQ